jgi:glucose/arabinose dehydrogenase
MTKIYPASKVAATVAALCLLALASAPGAWAQDGPTSAYVSDAVKHADGSTEDHTPPQATFTAFLNDDHSRVLLDNAPTWKDRNANITELGRVGLQAGNFRALDEGDSLTLRYTDRAAGERGVLGAHLSDLPTDGLDPSGPFTPLQLQEGSFPARPANVRREERDGGARVITWEAEPGLTYQVYRHSFADTMAAAGAPRRLYTRLAEDLTDGRFVDESARADRTYGYVVYAKNSAGVMSPHSDEVSGNIQASIALEEAFPELPDLDFMTDLQSPEDGSNRLFVLERGGRVKVFENRRDVSSTQTVLDISDQVVRENHEQGLLGLAFHPNFEENGYFFIDYTAPDPRRTVIARYRMDPDNPNQALASSKNVILEVRQPNVIHNAGRILFGPKGYLYITLGDGGGAFDPHENGQDPTTLLGSILRIDVDNPSGEKSYSVPSSNPFVDSTGYRDEIWAYGFRNPWRMSLDEETGRLWAGDVGQAGYEEVNLVKEGRNYGWDAMEGKHCYEPSSDCDRSGKTPPVHEYSLAGRHSITGGFVYRGPNVPQLQGTYVYADYVSGQIWGLDYSPETGGVQNTELLDTNFAIPSFAEDANQELYVLAFDGRIYRFEPTTNVAAEPPPQQRASQEHLLSQNAPNPFRSSTRIRYELPEPGRVTLRVYDAMGRRVATLVDRHRSAGKHAVRFAAEDLPSGVYFYRLRTSGRQRDTRKMTIVQ